MKMIFDYFIPNMILITQQMFPNND